MTSHTTPSLVKVTKAAASFGTPVSPLRVLIVDDDHINLSILGTLLKRRFSALLDGVPIAVDGGLKAIQALRQDVFDIVLLDVQMPGIDGVEVCKRIRNGSDGILAANQTAHVFATTTALGAVAEVVYERCGMTGTLPKPVRPANLASILLPLSKASSPSSTLVSVPDGAFVRSTVGGRHDPLPSSRADNDAPPSEAQIQKFADDLREQTKASLRSVRAMSVARSGTISHSGRLRTERCADSRSGSNASSDEHLPLTGSADGRRVTISARALCAQMAEEIARLDMVQLPLDSDNAPGSDSTTTDHTRDSALGLLPPPRLRTSPATGASTPVRPKALHRISAPAFLANSSPEARQQSALARKMPLSVQADAAGEYTSRQLTLSPTEQSRRQ
ncbi:CheY-like protein [Ceraceosorus guamensis]|uniref:CheY-like protein n=1 Tax=Ceraceosorus guamensis TaxID=1522189 RepID=A0A316VVN6_9BASI|nr:CheY-like protein [Ceraceosorus guamensis]PWN41008.1 CheY-like protein [Ceraceosorus guamensis]